LIYARGGREQGEGSFSRLLSKVARKGEGGEGGKWWEESAEGGRLYQSERVGRERRGREGSTRDGVDGRMRITREAFKKWNAGWEAETRYSGGGRVKST
jgi:hypothetical protein